MNAKLLVQKESTIKLAYTKCSNEIIIIINLLLVNKDGKNISYVEGGPRKGRGRKMPFLYCFLSLSKIDIY
jgi:hypothetical protein